MRRARMLSFLMMVLISIIIGCSQNRTGWFFKPSGKGSSDNEDTSQPVPTTPSAPQAPSNAVAAGNTSENAEGDEARLTELLKLYQGRFPSDDLDRKTCTDGTAASPPTTQPSLAAQNTPALSMQQSPQMQTDAAKPPAIAPVTIGVSLSNNTELAASPQPPQADEVIAAADGSSQLGVELIGVRAAPMSPMAVDTQTEVASANWPVQEPVGKSSSANSTGVADLISQLENTVSLNPQQLDDRFKLGMLYLATGQDLRANDSIEGTNPIQADLLSAFFHLVATTKQTISDPAASTLDALEAVDKFHWLLTQQSGVIIPKIELVTRVRSFGDYEAVSPRRFVAGQPVHVYLYTEVANFRSEPTNDQKLRTLLSEKVEIFDEKGKIIWQQAADQIEDIVSSHRRDFFIPMEIKLPAEIPTGEYVLKVTITDKLGATTDQQRMTFTISGL